MFGRIQRSADFELVLATPARARSAHFAAHYVAVAAAQSNRRQHDPASGTLSTMNPERCAQVVDDMAQSPAVTRWLGIVVPKRYARLAATRNLLRRQVRAIVLRHEPGMACGMWLIRLRAPFVRTDYASATSRALRVAARDELDRLLRKASQ